MARASNSPLMYVDCRALLERALESPKGIRITCDTHGQAIDLSRRINKARQLDRVNNAKIYPPDELMHNRSTFDTLLVSVPPISPEEAKAIGLDLSGDPKLDKELLRLHSKTVKITPRSAENYNVEEIE